VPDDEYGDGIVTPLTFSLAERLHRDGGHQRGIDPARQPDHHVLEPVLADVVARAQHERLVALVDRWQRDSRAGRQRRRRHLGRRGQRDPREGLGGPQLLLAAPRVVQARVEDGVEVEVGDDEVLGELAAPGHRLAALVDDQAAAVEDQLVLAAHHVDEGQAHQVVRRPGGDHPLALVSLAGVVRRGVDRHHQLGAGQGLPRGGPGRIPDVLADVDGEGGLAQLEHRRLGAGLEVAVLVEHAVVRQVLLVVDPAQRAVVQDGRRVEDVVTLVHEPTTAVRPAESFTRSASARRLAR
jgi:hypothetical protein